MSSVERRPWGRSLLSLLALTAMIVGLKLPISGPLALETLVDPAHGLWGLARQVSEPPPGQLNLPILDGPVEVVWDERAVPHIFAESDADAIRAFGWVVARDRLFQMDFLRRVTAGRLAEVLGPDLVDTDRYLRDTGMVDAVRDNVEAMRREDAIDLQAAGWFADGVNAYLDDLHDVELPLEFRLLGYRPGPWQPEDAFLVGWNLMFDLTFQREGALVAGQLREALGEAAFNRLFPAEQPQAVPIVRDEDRHWNPSVAARNERSPRVLRSAGGESLSGLGAERDGIDPLPRTEGFLEGKGSNNWAVSGSRSATGAPIVAGDMHLGLNLPAIWYEVHLVTPDMNTYGVTVPGVPIPIEAFNTHVGWAFTNTGSDQIDHLALDLDPEGRSYRYDGEWRPLEMRTDTIHVLGEEPVAHTVRWSHWGPVTTVDGQEIATLWTGHSRIRTFQALWEMNRAGSYAEFEEALRLWDVPMQNILVGAPGDTIAIRSTGYLPIRADGDGYGVRDGGDPASEWIGRVPFDELPHAINPDRGYLASTNQRPAPAHYPYYLGRNWSEVFRSLRIEALLTGKPEHTVEDLASYQADVIAAQWDMLRPFIENLGGLTPPAAAYRGALLDWDGRMETASRLPLLFAEWEGRLHDLVWDEPEFGGRRPVRARVYDLLVSEPDSPWFDRPSTPEVEDSNDILRAALEAAAESEPLEGPAWGEVHGLLLRHITGSGALRPLWRGPIPYPGYTQTLSPGSGRNVTHSASWRVVLDFSGERVAARGIYPGGQSGHPFSPDYDASVRDFASFVHYALHTPSRPGELAAPRYRTTILP